ncbi:MAG TPA: hypothetical protein PLW11_07420 [Bacillota bacterium]|nr:hypothetical protein [Bacillota bacterium]
MYIEEIKKLSLRYNFLKVLLIVVLVIILTFYLKAFFTIGVYYDDAFLKKEQVSSERHYIGKNKYGNLHITVKGLTNKSPEAEVIFKLPKDINKQYTVAFKDAGNWDQGIKNIKDGGDIVFEGDYRKGSYFLFDKNGRPLISDAVRVRVNGEISYNGNYEFSLKDVADFTYSAGDAIRGKYQYFVSAIFLFVITLIDVRYPLFFFNLKHFLNVRDPEPSDFYISMQRLSWIINPMIGIVLMIAAIS